MTETLLLVLLLFAPFAFGAVEPWAELVVITLSAMLGTCVAMRLVLGPEPRLTRTAAFVPLVVFLTLAAIQLMPLPASLLMVLSPNTVATRTRYLSDLPDAARQLKSFPISMYPHATRHDLRLVAAASAIFFAVVNYYRRPEQIKRLLAVIAFVGAALALLAFAQDVSRTTRIYFIGPDAHRIASAGPFVLYSHFCQFMNLCVGASLALLLLVLHRKFSQKGFRFSDLPDGWRNAGLRSIWLLAAIIVLGVTTIFLSYGRGGMLASLLGFVLVTFSLARNKGLPGRAWLVLPLILVIFAVLSFVGLDPVFSRLGTLSQADTTGGRLPMLEDLTHVWRQYPLFGTGLGTHEVVYPRYDRSIIHERASHAEDEYAQVIEEMGFPGLALVLWFATIVWLNFARALRTGEIASQLVATGLGFGLLAVMMHSLTDFGQHVPAVACLTAVVCGLIISVGQISSLQQEDVLKKDPSIPDPTGSQWFGRLGLGGLAGLMMVVAVWAILGAGPSVAADSQWKLAQAKSDVLSQNQWQGTSEEYTDLVTHAAAAVQRDPDEVEHRLVLNVYRWRWSALRNSPNTERSLAAVRQDSRQILDDLNVARSDCPVYGPVYYFAALIENNLFAGPLAERHAQEAYELSQTDASACLLAARADVKAGRWNESKAKFSRYLSLGGGFSSVIDAYVRQARRPDLALELAQNNAAWLEPLASALRNDPRYTEQADQIDTRVFELMKQRCSQSDVSAEMLVEFAGQALKHHDLPTAIAAYRRAIELDYGQADWHLALARALAQDQQVPQAMREARICLRLRPQMSAAQQLVGDLSLLPAGRGE